MGKRSSCCDDAMREDGSCMYCEEEPMTKEIQRWADRAMFSAEPMTSQKPTVQLIWMTPDPLGAIAACAKMYKGEVARSLADITDEERVQYFEDGTKTVLGAPFEDVQFHFLIEGVTRGFTHQLVRQRTATYFQESTRFAVMDEIVSTRVGLPPSLDGTHSLQQDYLLETTAEEEGVWHEPSQAQQWRNNWDRAMAAVELAYQENVRTGQPAEDARGMLPTNLLTRIHYRTNLRDLIGHAGNRLCTQAQFEWRYVFNQIVEAIKTAEVYVPTGRAMLELDGEPMGRTKFPVYMRERLATLFAPVCYQQGKCGFKASFDRACSIRERVDANAAVGRPPSEWNRSVLIGEPTDLVNSIHRTSGGVGYNIEDRPHKINAIHPAEWALDPGAARS